MANKMSHLPRDIEQSDFLEYVVGLLFLYPFSITNNTWVQDENELDFIILKIQSVLGQSGFKICGFRISLIYYSK